MQLMRRPHRKETISSSIADFNQMAECPLAEALVVRNLSEEALRVDDDGFPICVRASVEC